MKIIESPREMQVASARLRQERKTLGLAPTMGYFHDGHLSLMRRARRECDTVVVSLFVNPTQFGPGEDYEKYPRDLERDLRLAEAEQVDLIFAPSAKAMYSADFATYVEVEGLTSGLCGAARPGHFRGMATVVTKLFNLVRPHRAYFGEKDYQQLRVIERLTEDLNLDVQIVRCPIVREPDGLALSSRNTYLDPEQRLQATALFRSLEEARQLFAGGERDALAIRECVRARIEAEPLTRVDYVETVDAETLQPVETVEQPVLVAVAVRFGDTRLIDNTVLVPHGE